MMRESSSAILWIDRRQKKQVVCIKLLDEEKQVDVCLNWPFQFNAVMQDPEAELMVAKEGRFEIR